MNLAAVLHAPGDVRLEERPDPRPGPREVAVEAIMTGTYGLRETEAALRAGREDPAAIKPIVLPQQDSVS